MCWIGIKLRGVESHQQAIGSKLRIVDELGHIHYKELTAGHGWTSQNSGVLYVGLGMADSIDSLKVSWPSGFTQQLVGPAINQYYTIIEGELPIEGIINEPLVTSSPLLHQTGNALRLEAFPNPARDKLRLQIYSQQSEDLSLQVLDVLGKVLFTQYIKQAGLSDQQIDIDLSQFSSQKLLIFQVRSADQMVTKSVIRH